MKRIAIAIAALCFVGHASAQDLLGSEDSSVGTFSDIPVDIEGGSFIGDRIISTASGNMKITYGATTIYCDEAQFDPNTKDLVATGNVRIYREGKLTTADRAVYNLETKDITAATVRGEALPFVFSGTSMQNIAGSNGYLLKDTLFTTSDTANPDWSMRSRRVRIYPNDHMVFRDVKLYLGNTPVFWLPYLYQSLNKKNAFTLTPGYSSVAGAYLYSNYTFPISETMGGTLRLDYRSLRGPAIGFDTEWEDGEKKQNWGRFRSYVMDDASPGTNKTALARDAVDSSRYRVGMQARQYLTEDIFATVDINKLSDARFLQDFYEGEFRQDPQPDNSVALTKAADDYELTFLARKQFNEFFDGTERLPELALDITRQPFLGSRVFYEGQTSVGRYSRNFANGSTSEDYNATRVDSFHQFLLPYNVGGWLSVVPSVGVRGTWYSQSGPVLDFPETTTRKLTNGTTKTTTTTFQRLQEEGQLFRPVVNAGLEVSFKASRAYEQIQSRAWGLDGLRHILQPYLNLSFVESGADSKDVLKFDRLQRSTQPPPIDFTTFNSIDSITDWNVVRLGIRNRLQTRRDNATFNWLELNTFVDLRIDAPDFGLEPDRGTFSNLVNRLRWTPLTWVSFTLDSQVPIFDAGFNEVNTRATFFVNDRVQFNVGHRYLDHNVLFQNSSLMDVGGYFRFDDNWAFSFREQYEFNDGLLQSQRYEVHRDLASWVASLGVINNTSRGNAGKDVNNLGVILTFSLKDLPDVNVPLSFDPSSQSGSGKNR